MEDASNLSKRLQQCMPLSKIIHLNLETDLKKCSHQVIMHTSMQLTVDDKLIEVVIK
nr:MAG TPA: hypothetical protein [Siphoviridae sp. ct8Ri8]